MTTVTVGTEKELFITYSDLLSFYLPRIRKVFATFGRQQLKLRDVHPSTFKVFLDWARSDGNHLPKWDVHKRSDTDLDEPREVDKTESVEDLDAYYRSQPEAEAVDCYIFAYNYEIRQFMNDLFDSILEINPESDLVPSYSVVLKVWQELPATSHLRRYLIELFARVWTHKTDVGYREELILRKQVPSEFWIAMLVQRSENDELDDYPPWENDLCQYHDHEKGEKKHCYWQHINDGEGYCTDYSEESGSDMDEYESDFIDDAEPGSDNEESMTKEPIDRMDEDLPPWTEDDSSPDSPDSSVTVSS